MIINFKDILIVLTFFQLFLFSFIILVKSKFTRLDQLFLGLFFFSLAFNIFNYFIFQHIEYFSSLSIINLFYLGSPFAFCYAPAFFLYILLNLNPVKRLRWNFGLHFLPFLIFGIYIFFSFTVLPEESKKKILIENGLFDRTIYIALIVLIHLQVIIYSVFCFKKIYYYKRKLKDIYSSRDKLNFSWIRAILWAVLCLWLLDLSRFVFSFVSESTRLFIESSLFIGFLIFCYFFLFKAMSGHFDGFDEDTPTDNKKYSLSLLLRKKYEKQLTQFMELNKPYLNPELTLRDLSDMVSIPPRSLSEVLSTSFRQNFYDYINSYRIRESELLLSDWEIEKTVLEVLYEVGFNSKSSFNTSFKKLTGMTPTAYRRYHRMVGEPQKQII